MDEYPLETVLDLACAAQRVNKEYLKDVVPIFDEEYNVLYYKETNKTLILFSLDSSRWNFEKDSRHKPALLNVTREDRELANEIRKYFRKLMFAAVKGDNEFFTEVNALLSSERVPINKIGFIACLPSVYRRDYAESQFEKRIQDLDSTILSPVGSVLYDLDSEILDSKRSKNFDAWNINAIINNRLVSWFSKVDLKPGPCVVIKAKVKELTPHWKHTNVQVTRLHYVKAAQ